MSELILSGGMRPHTRTPSSSDFNITIVHVKLSSNTVPLRATSSAIYIYRILEEKTLSQAMGISESLNLYIL